MSFYVKRFIALLFISLGGLFYLHYYLGRSAAHTLPTGKTITFEAVVSDEPTESGNYEIAAVTPTGPDQRTIDLFAFPESGLQYGDLLEITGKVQPPTSIGDDPAIFLPKKYVIAEGKGFWLRADLIDLKEALLQKFNDVLPQDEAALLGGITFGGTAGMTAGLKNAMDLSGTSYIATLYGLKIGMLVFILGESLIGYLPRRAVFFITGAAIILFVMMSGGNASAVRAGIMAFLALAARESGRVLNKANALALTACTMLLFDPTLIAQAAFQLSFLSILGIVYLAPAIKRLVRYKGPGFLAWREHAIIAAATLFAMMPVALASFGDFSLTAFLSNALVMLFILPLAMLGLAIAASGFVFHYLSFVLARLAAVFLWYELAVIKLFAAFVVPLPAIFATPLAAACYYVALIIFVRHHHESERIS